MRILKQSTNVHVVMGPLVDETDAVTPITAPTLGNITAARIINGETRTAITLAASGDNEFAHLADGYFELDLTTTDTGTLGQLTITLRDDDGFLPVWADFTVVPAHVYDGLVAGTDKLQVDTTQWLGTAVTTDGSTSLPDVHVDAIGSSTANATSLGTAIDTTDNVVACNVTQISDSGTAADNLETASTTLVGGKIDANVGAISGDTTAADTLEAMLDTTGVFTVDDSGFSPTTTAFETSTGDATDDHYNGQTIRWITGDLAGQEADVSDYTGSNNRWTVGTMTDAPSNGDTFVCV